MHETSSTNPDSVIHVFEYFDADASRKAQALTHAGERVAIVQPFRAHHYACPELIEFQPRMIPDSLRRMIDEGLVELIPAEELGSGTLFLEATEWSVVHTQHAWDACRADCSPYVDALIQKMASAAVEKAWKKKLCEELALYYSAQMTYIEIAKQFSGQRVRVYCAVPMDRFARIRKWAMLSGISLGQPETLELIRGDSPSFWARWKDWLYSTCAIVYMLLTACKNTIFSSSPNPIQQSFVVNVVSPLRQLEWDHWTRPDFLIRIGGLPENDVAYVSDIVLSKAHREALDSLPGQYYWQTAGYKHARNPGEWLSLLWLALSRHRREDAESLRICCAILHHYQAWTGWLDKGCVKHFVTYSNWGISHYGRNIALEQAGVQTWFFNDSGNQYCYLQKADSGEMIREPMWAFLHYDHLVTWSPFFAEYYRSHPEAFSEVHVMGCFPAGKIPAHEGGTVRNSPLQDLSIAVFDSGYTYHAHQNLEEAQQFITDIQRVLQEYPAAHATLKQKKGLDYALGVLRNHEYAEYIKASGTPAINGRYKVIPITTGTYDLIAASQISISYPFTSVTFEALSAGRIAIWYDPQEKYRGTVWDTVPGVFIHGYDELRQVIKAMLEGTFSQQLETDPLGLLDPYRDGKAIERFGSLLQSR